LRDGPQLITRRGEKTAIVMSYEEYVQMKTSQTKLSEFFRASPLTKVNLNLKRDKSLPREGTQL
jgi:prevent-host-death family protein